MSHPTTTAQATAAPATGRAGAPGSPGGTRPATPWPDRAGAANWDAIRVSRDAA